MLLGLVRGADDHDLEVLDPVARGRGRHDMPVIARLQEQELRALARGVHEPAARRVGQRQPRLEVGVDRKWVIPVVEHLVVLGAGGHDEVIEATAREGGVGARAKHAQVVAEILCGMIVHGLCQGRQS